MKIALFALGVLALAQGLELENGSLMEVEFDYEEDEPGAGQTCLACITPPCGWTKPRNHCHGIVEIRSVLNGNEEFHGKMDKIEGDATPLRVKKMEYKPKMKRGSTKIIEVNGNCCWKFYEK